MATSDAEEPTPAAPSADPLSRVEVDLPAAPESVGALRAAARSFAVARGADDGVVATMVLAVSEAATNAVMHGFVDREPGTVRMVLKAGHGELVVRVIDDGRGMQPRTDSPGMGIGLPTIGQLARELDIREASGGGTVVQMTFAAPGVDGVAEASGSTGDERMRLLLDVARLAEGEGWPADGVEAMVELLVPAVADVCAVDLVGPDGAPRRLAGHVHGEPELSAWLAGRAPQARYEDSPTYRALDSGMPQVLDVTAGILRAAAHDGEDLAALRRLDVRRWVTVPLRAGEHPHGLLHLGLHERRGEPGADELAFYELIAERASRGLGHTQLIDELRRTRRRLEQILGALNEAVTVNDGEGRLIYANPAALELIGAADLDEVLDASPNEYAARFRVSREDGTALAADDFPGRRLLHGKDAPPLVTRAVHLPSGRERWLLTRAALLDDEGPLAVNFVTDITEARIAERRNRLLAASSKLLLGGWSPDHLQHLADMVVEEISDWCTIDLREDGVLRRVAVAHRDPAKLDIAKEIDQRWPPDPRPGAGIAELLDGGPAITVTELTEEMLAARAVDAEHLELIRRVGLRSVVVAPIRDGTVTYGALTLITAESSRTFDGADRDFACDLAERLALALRHARAG